MFTGLVREFAEVKALQNNILTLKAKYKPQIGDSICVNGACLTTIKLLKDGFSLEISEESQSHLALENYQNFVHIEPALRLTDRLDGHLLQGHIDALGVITQINPHPIGTDFFIQTDFETLEFCSPKGSIALDGVSLTINEVFTDSLRLTLIPHTLKNTLFKNYKVGRRVNIETDMFAKMIVHFLKNTQNNKQNPKTLPQSWREIDAILGSY